MDENRYLQRHIIKNFRTLEVGRAYMLSERKKKVSYKSSRIRMALISIGGKLGVKLMISTPNKTY